MAPLVPLPVIQEPFQRIAIDIVGPLQRSLKGNKYLLTLMDFATRYPEGVPLRRIDAESVAEALCHVFTRLGIPEEILSDRGSNFMSELMANMFGLLQVEHIKASPYHPETNGMLERFHATLKAMLRKTRDHPKNWDDWVPYVLFAYRDAPQAATGFSPFELLFGRGVRGPLSVVQQQWTGKKKTPQSVVSFVLHLQERLAESHKLARESEEKAKQEGKAWHDKKAGE